MCDHKHYTYAFLDLSQNLRQCAVHVITLGGLPGQFFLQLDIVRVNLRERLTTALRTASHSNGRAKTEHALSKEVRSTINRRRAKPSSRRRRHTRTGTNRNRELSSVQTIQDLAQFRDSVLSLLRTGSLSLNFVLQSSFTPLSTLTHASPLLLDVLHDSLCLCLTILHHLHQPFQTSSLAGVCRLLFSELAGQVLDAGECLSELVGLRVIR